SRPSAYNHIALGTTGPDARPGIRESPTRRVRAGAVSSGAGLSPAGLWFCEVAREPLSYRILIATCRGAGSGAKTSHTARAAARGPPFEEQGGRSMRATSTLKCAAPLLVLPFLLVSARAADSIGTLAIRSQGYFYVAGRYDNPTSPRYMSGQMYVEYQILDGPAKYREHANGSPTFST